MVPFGVWFLFLFLIKNVSQSFQWGLETLFGELFSGFFYSLPQWYDCEIWRKAGQSQKWWMERGTETDEEKMAIFLISEVVPPCLGPSHLWSTSLAVLAESPCQVPEFSSSAVCASLDCKGETRNQKITLCNTSPGLSLAYGKRCATKSSDLLLLWAC